VKNLIPYAMLGFLILGVVGLCVSLVQLLKASLRTGSRRSGPDPVQLRAAVASTRASLVELRTILSSEVAGSATRQAGCISLLGRPEVELFQKVRKYQMAPPEAALGEPN